MSELDFFNDHYKTLRPGYTPMKWMRRMFLRLIGGEPPSLVDLPTGAGKTDLVVIWLVALAWYAQHRSTTKVVPRRLVWVVNRRVLVQQVYDVAESLDNALKSHSGPAVELASHLRSLCQQDSEGIFNVVQLRGQRLDDREWSLDPTMPQLIIGTVDQIGSRLLFQGYGQGKWSRPMHAGLFGVDAWVCIDEAHLVPAFAVTLRQIREMACRTLAASVPEPVAQFFGQLPFWTTELSATPGLPAPQHGDVFRLEGEDETDEVIADRLLAKKTRRVIWKPQQGKKLADELAKEALRIANEVPGSAIAVFCRIANDAEAVATKLKEKHESRVLLVTGRIRGYERDRLEKNELFQRFRQGHPEAPTAGTPPTVLVGTAAAEVGLDADASAIVCDFADLLTLIQRLGRLDRRGQLSKRATDAKTPPPTMTIIGGSNGKSTQAQLTALAGKLGASRPANGFEYGAEFFTGAPWSLVVGKEKGDADDDESGSVTETSQDKGGAKPGVEDAIASATWRVLALPSNLASASAEENPQPEPWVAPTKDIAADTNDTQPVSQTPSTAASTSQDARQPTDWLNDPLAVLNAGPVVVPPLSDAGLKRWAATTPRPSKFLPVHPWLYGLLPDAEGTPLVGIAFRLELDILQHCRESDEDDGDTDRTWEKIEKCLTAFPPLNSELHFVRLDEARKWLEMLPEKQRLVLAHFDGEEWTNSILAEELNPNSVLVLPTSTPPAVVNDIIPKDGDQSDAQRCWDVFEALAKDGAKYRRTVTSKSGHIQPGQKNEPGVYRVPEFGAEGEPAESAVAEDKEPAAPLDETEWKPAGMKLSFAKDGISFDLRYFKPRRDAGAVLDLLPDHLTAAAEHGRQLAQALAPGNAHLAALLSRTAADHDKGKDHAKWQQAMGNTPAWQKAEGHDDSVLVAKPVIENPGRAGGYRHEWGTLWRIKDDSTPILSSSDAATETLLRDLYLHGIAAHHGYFRPSMPDRGFDAEKPAQQNRLRLEAIECSARLQGQLGYWRLAYLESLIKIADVAASRDAQTEED
jgi:hypothetical protein